MENIPEENQKEVISRTWDTLNRDPKLLQRLRKSQNPPFFNLALLSNNMENHESRASRAMQKRKDRRRGARRRVRLSADQDAMAAGASVRAHVPTKQKRQREGTLRPPSRRENSPERAKQSSQHDQPTEGSRPPKNPAYKKGYYTSKYQGTGPSRRHF